MPTEATEKPEGTGRPQADGKPEVPSKTWVFAFGVYLIILIVLLIYPLFRLWPEQLTLKAGHGVVRLVAGYWEPDVWMEARFLALVALSGALGSYIHLATSFADYLGNQRFFSSWSGGTPSGRLSARRWR